MYILFLLFCFIVALLIIVQISSFTSTGRLITAPLKMIKAMFQKAATDISLLYSAIFTCWDSSKRTTRLCETVF